MNKCGTCTNRDSDGYCQSDRLSEDYGQYRRTPEAKADALVYSYHEGGGFWVGPNFGCVHWASKGATV